MLKSIQCLIVDDERVAREILEDFLIKIETVDVVASCSSALEAFKVINTNKVDLIFLDINMPEISGLSFAKSINKNTKIIFTTAYREYALEGFDLRAVDYLLKPISFDRLLQAINKFTDENIQTTSEKSTEIIEEKSDYIFVRSDRKMVKINFSKIRYIESLSDYIKIYLVNKTVVTRETISNIEAKLPGNEFIRVHRSFIISLSKVESFTNETIEIGENEIPISRSYKKEVLNRLEDTSI